MKKSAFTMIELVFVIVVLGILTAVAIPRFSATRDDAFISKGRSDIASIRSGIVTERQNRLIKGDSKYISGNSLNSNGLFGGVLHYGLKDSTKPGQWHSVSTSDSKNTYTYKVGTSDTTFTYTKSDGKFTCTTGTYCSDLIN